MVIFAGGLLKLFEPLSTDLVTYATTARTKWKISQVTIDSIKKKGIKIVLVLLVIKIRLYLRAQVGRDI